MTLYLKMKVLVFEVILIFLLRFLHESEFFVIFELFIRKTQFFKRLILFFLFYSQSQNWTNLELFKPSDFLILEKRIAMLDIASCCHAFSICATFTVFD